MTFRSDYLGVWVMIAGIAAPAASASRLADPSVGGRNEPAAANEAAFQAHPPEEPAVNRDRQPARRESERQRERAAVQHIARLKQLQAAMEKQLDLKPQQHSAITRLFSAYLRSLSDRRGGSRPFGANPGDPDRLKELRAKMIEARRAGDEKAARAYREQARDMLRSRSTAIALSTSQFLTRVGAELNAEQRKEFRELVRRLRIGTPAAARGEDLRPLWRAVMRPELSLSEDQRRTISRMLRDGFAAVAQARRSGDEERAGQIAATVRADVLAALTPDQRSKVQAIRDKQRAREWNPQREKDENHPDDDH